MSRKDRSYQPRDLAQDDESQATTVNWRPLQLFPGHGAPSLLWLSIPHATERAEYDSPALPDLASVEQRHRWNSRAGEQDGLLGCKGFWEAFRQSKLVIVFDRHIDTRLLKRLRDEVQPSQIRSLETLIIFAGKDEKTARVSLVKEIETALAQARVKFHFLPEMTSTAAPFPHDRFAVTNGEFWHFGGSNAGYEPCLTAVSRGWRAESMGVRKFIDSAWTAIANQRTTT